MGSVIAHWVFVLIMYFTTQMKITSQDHQLAVIVVTLFLVNAPLYGLCLAALWVFVLIMYFTNQMFFLSQS